MSDYAPCPTAQPSSTEDMMAHIHTDRSSKFSISDSGDDVSIHWESKLLFFTDPFTSTHSPTDLIPPPPSPFKNLPTLPSSPTGSPSAVQLGDTDVSHEIECTVSTTVPADESLNKSRTFQTRHQSTALEQSQTLEQLSNRDITGVRVGQPDEQKENKSVQTENGRVGVLRAQPFRVSSVRQTCKRKTKDALNHDTDQVFPKPAPRKRICREKTGTDWQTVLDIVAYSEERSRSQIEGGMTANI
ncbi:hypothetical protein EDD22DRAFT_955773 [Suillus occidentalis]|nr:hypothetical protein EDD22DRAFT_955773 [Suillus occidentalis]